MSLWEDEYTLECENGHEWAIKYNALKDSLIDGRCEECGADIVNMEPHEVCISCPCGFSENNNAGEAVVRFETGCPDADAEFEASFNLAYHKLALYKSDEDLHNNYEWAVHGSTASKLVDLNSEDYWDYVTHFTNFEGFYKILQSKIIEANPAGFFYRTNPSVSNAVCLTETPVKYAERFFDSFGEYGFVFKKSDLHPLGLLPIMHLTREQIDEQDQNLGGFVNSIVPFIQLLRTNATGGGGRRIDFIHEREWRVPQSIILRTTKPVGLFFADPIRFNTDGGFEWRTKIDGALEFNVVSL